MFLLIFFSSFQGLFRLAGSTAKIRKLTVSFFMALSYLRKAKELVFEINFMICNMIPVYLFTHWCTCSFIYSLIVFTFILSVIINKCGINLNITLCIIVFVTKFQAEFDAGLVDLSEFEGDVHVVTGIISSIIITVTSVILAKQHQN